MIDPFHDLFGFPDSGRPLYARGRLRVEGRTPEREPLEWTGGEGTGLGSIELEVAKAIRGGAAGGPAIAIVARAMLPTSSGAFGEAGRGAGASALFSYPLGGSFDLHAGGGATVLGPSTRDGLSYERTRARVSSPSNGGRSPRGARWLQWEASSRLVTGVDGYPGLQLSLRIGSKVDAGAWRLEGGFIEGIKDLDNTTDFGVFAAVGRRF